MIYSYEHGDDAEKITMWCEEYSGSEPIQCIIGMYSCVVVSRELESDDEDDREDTEVVDIGSAGWSAERAGITEGTSVNTEFIGANHTVSEGVTMGQVPIFIEPMTGVKILSTSSTVLRAKQTY